MSEQPYRHILLAANYSKESELVNLKAKQLAALFQSKLSIVHVVDDIPLPDTGYGAIIAMTTEFQDVAIKQARNNLLQVAKQLGAQQENCWLIWGNPNQEVELFAEKINADLIVVGSHAKHGLALLLGSVADNIMHHAQCDVLAVRLVD